MCLTRVGGGGLQCRGWHGASLAGSLVLHETGFSRGHRHRIVYWLRGARCRSTRMSFCHRFSSFRVPELALPRFPGPRRVDQSLQIDGLHRGAASRENQLRCLAGRCDPPYGSLSTSGSIRPTGRAAHYRREQRLSTRANFDVGDLVRQVVTSATTLRVGVQRGIPPGYAVTHGRTKNPGSVYDCPATDDDLRRISASGKLRARRRVAAGRQTETQSGHDR